MSAPERIWAWWEFDNDHRAINQWEDEMSSDPNAVYDHAAYIREDTVAEMIRQAVADAESKALRKVVAKIRPSLSPSGNGVVIAALHREADAIEAMIPKED